MKISKIIFLLASLLFLTACWDRYELEERANILGLAVDIADEETRDFTIPETVYKGEGVTKGEQPLYRVTAQLAVPGKIKLGPEGGGEGGSKKTSWVLETVGYTMDDAMMNLQQQLAEKLYLGHLQIIVVNKEIAEKGLTDINDFLRREYEVRRTAWLIISEDDAKEVLEAAPPVETVPSLYISETLENSTRFGKLPKEYLGKYWVDMADIGIDPNLPYVKVIEKERIMVKGLAFFNEDKMVGEMTPFEIGVYLAMKEQNPGGYSVAVSTNDGGVYIVETATRKSDIKVKVKNGQPSANINIKVLSNIKEETKVNDLNNERIAEIEKESSKEVVKKANELVKKWQENESDVLGLGALVRSKYPKYWNDQIKNAENWDKVYKEMDININIKVQIKRTGMEYK